MQLVEHRNFNKYIISSENMRDIFSELANAKYLQWNLIKMKVDGTKWMIFRASQYRCLDEQIEFFTALCNHTIKLVYL